MAASSHPIEQLIALARRYRHLHGESDRAAPGSLRREHQGELEEIRRQYDTLVDRWIRDPADRELWRAFLGAGEDPPEDPLTRTPPVFVGRSAGGARLEVRAAGADDYELLVDGRSVDRLGQRLSLDHGQSTPLHILDQDWRETSEAPAPAMEALRAHRATGRGAPPWEWARDLFADGLIDANFGLTRRGQRLLRNGS